MLVLTFKVFERKGIPIFQAIVFNYLAATVCAFVFLPDKAPVYSGSILHEPWLPFALLLGSMFIIVFNLTSITTVRYGVSTASVAMKLGLVFPVMLAFVIYGENFSLLKLAGILFAFVSVILSSLRSGESHSSSTSAFAVLPLVVFLGSGMCDSFTQYANKTYLAQKGMEEFSFFLFVAAAFFGVCMLTFQLLAGKSTIKLNSLIGGVILGVINYFSFLFILKALATVSWGSSVVFPISNLGTVVVATLAGILFFNEKLSKANAIGLLRAGISILLIVFSN